MAEHGGKDVILGIRPEHLELVAGAPDAVPMTVTMVEQLGADTLVHGHFGESQSNLTVRLDGIRNIKGGEVLPIRVTPDHLHLFDPSTERRLS
jgi:sn-glycerol 3-phosphate transport system ATP-binding protein